MVALDSHFAKLAIPRATWARTSGCPHLTIPNNAFIPPSDHSLAWSLSAKPNTMFQIFWSVRKEEGCWGVVFLPLPQRLAIAPATIRKVCGSSASAAVNDSKLIPPWSTISCWLTSVTPHKQTNKNKHYELCMGYTQRTTVFLLCLNHWSVMSLPFIARFAIAPAATLRTVSSS